jgi:hypothetical protein
MAGNKDMFGDDFREELDPERLCEAAKAAMEAAADVAEYTGKPAPYPLDLMGAELQPACLERFSRWEIEQACDFLVRMGFLEGQKKAA